MLVEETIVREDLETPPLIAGAVYRYVEPDGTPIEGVCQGTRKAKNGLLAGTIYYQGRMEYEVHEKTKSFMGWELVAMPTVLEEPIGSVNHESELDKLRREMQALRDEMNDLATGKPKSPRSRRKSTKK